MKKILCLLLCLLLTGCTGAPAETEPVELKGMLTVYCMEGAVLVQCNGENLLVDCEITPQALEEYGVESLSAIVLTDSEENQKENLDAILEQYPAEVWSSEDFPEKDQWLDCARLTLLGQEDAVALKIQFGEDSFLVAGNMSPEQQTALTEKEDLQADVLCIRGDADSAVLPEAVNPAYLVVDGKTQPEVCPGAEVFGTDDFGPLTLNTKGSGIEISWSLHVSHDVAS